IYRDPRARMSSIDLRYDVGTSDDPYAHPGYALLAGYAVVAASNSLPDVELTTQLSVDPDRTELTTTTLDLDRGLDLYAARLGMTCADQSLAAVKPRALQQLNGLPPSFGQAVWGQAHPYAHELGNASTEQIDAAALCGFYRAHYGTSVATLVLTGNLPADIVARIASRFGPLPSAKLAPRTAIPVLTTTTQRVRTVVWDLNKPTAALAFQVPAPGDQDDVTVDLALRKLGEAAQEHQLDLRTALLGGARGRVLVLGIEADSEAGLGKAHEQLRDLLREIAAPIEDETNEAVNDDQLGDAQTIDDELARGDRIADAIASGRKVDLLRRSRAFAIATSPRNWMRKHLVEGPSRMLDLVPAVPGQGQSIDSLVDAAQFMDRSIAGAFSTEAADPGAAPLEKLARPVEDYSLGNGLRVILASDPIASMIDVRLVFPAGTRDESAQGIALRGATDLVIADGFRADADAPERIDWYSATATHHTDVDVTQVSTHFRTTGFAVLGDWHLWSVAWRVITGSYESSELEPWKRHYAPKGATLIVSGGFAPAVAKPIIERWYGPKAWKQPTAVPPPAIAALVRRVITYDPGPHADSVELELRYGAATTGSRGAAAVLATLLQQRLALVLRSKAIVTALFDSRDRKLVLTAQIDPQAATDTATAIANELARVRASGVSQQEIAAARRRAVAQTLAAEISVGGRAQQIEANVVAKLLPNDQAVLEEIQAATADDVSEAARQLIDPAALVATVKANKSDPIVKALGFDPAKSERR
ncbi:MAG TPA: insulinase family protein, partial [Kofleriaceae bacterium]